jgi:hypothetical protein
MGAEGERADRFGRPENGLRQGPEAPTMAGLLEHGAPGEQ